MIAMGVLGVALASIELLTPKCLALLTGDPASAGLGDAVVAQWVRRRRDRRRRRPATARRELGSSAGRPRPASTTAGPRSSAWPG